MGREQTASGWSAPGWPLLVFALVSGAVFLLPPPSAFIASLPDTLRPESIFLLVFLAGRLACSRKMVKLSLEFSFLVAMASMVVSLAWAGAGQGIHFMVQDLVDIYAFFLFWAVFRYGYDLTFRYGKRFLRILTVVLFAVATAQLIVVAGQRMNLGAIISISPWWSHDYDAVPWLRITRPHGMTANAISLSILMAMFFAYFIGKILARTGEWREKLLAQLGLVFSMLIVILTKSRSGFALLLILPLFFALSAKSYLQRIVFASVKILGIMVVCVVVLVGATKISGFQGKFILGTAAAELMGRIGNFAREGLHDKEGAVGRLDDARLAFSQLRESPYVGIGPAHALGRAWFHSAYITLLRRYGVIGFVVYLLPYLLTALQAAQAILRYPGSRSGPSLVLFSACFCLLAGGITNYTFIGEWQMNYFFWLLAGTVLALQRKGEPPLPGPDRGNVVQPDPTRRQSIKLLDQQVCSHRQRIVKLQGVDHGASCSAVHFSQPTA